jgi:Protein of unknown function (DUF3644)
VSTRTGRPGLSSRFLDKAQSAMVAALEIHNKPQFAYREETFALLAVNAWELLLKAKLLRDNNNNVKIIREYEKRPTKQGKPGRRERPKKNRSGNSMTISLGRCIAQLGTKADTRLDAAVQNNLFALVEIRDNAAHYLHASPVLAKHALEIAAANVANFVVLVKRWFGRNLAESFSLILPLAFAGVPDAPTTVAVTADEKRLLTYLQGLATTTGTDDQLHVALRLNVKLQRSRLESGVRVRVTNDADAINVILSEEDIRINFPWDYAELCRRCRERYEGFKTNPQFHSVRKPLRGNAKLVYSRLLDPGNPRSAKKDYYNPNIIQEFDRHFRRRP